MKNYEAVIILLPDMEEENRNAVIEKLKNIVTDRKGTVESIDEWGKKKLAYEINKIRQGYYYLINFSSESDAVDEINRICKIDENVMRHMVVRKED